MCPQLIQFFYMVTLILFSRLFRINVIIIMQIPVNRGLHNSNVDSKKTRNKNRYHSGQALSYTQLTHDSPLTTEHLQYCQHANRGQNANTTAIIEVVVKVTMVTTVQEVRIMVV